MVIWSRTSLIRPYPWIVRFDKGAEAPMASSSSSVPSACSITPLETRRVRRRMNHAGKIDKLGHPIRTSSHVVATRLPMSQSVVSLLKLALKGRELLVESEISDSCSPIHVQCPLRLLRCDDGLREAGYLLLRFRRIHDPDVCPVGCFCRFR